MEDGLAQVRLALVAAAVAVNGKQIASSRRYKLNPPRSQDGNSGRKSKRQSDVSLPWLPVAGKRARP